MMTVDEPTVLPAPRAPRNDGRGLLEVTETVDKLALDVLLRNVTPPKIPITIGSDNASFVNLL